MFPSLLGLLVLSVPLQTRCEQVAPRPRDGIWARSPKQQRAVLLIHGYRLHLRKESVPVAELRGWQRAEGALVKELARHADVFAFAYGQDADLDAIVSLSSLRRDIARFRRLGYQEIVLVGFSAGGLIARHFVEDYPDDGVTRIIQLATPNGGTPIASLYGPSNQRAFLNCLTETGRRQCLQSREGKRIPDHVQCVCIVCRYKRQESDGVVNCTAQWTADLQAQGIPATTLSVQHREAPYSAAAVKLLAELVQRDQPRWHKDRVDQARKEVLEVSRER